MYMKAEVEVHSKYGYERVYIYIKKDKEEKINLQDNVENMCNNEDLEGTIDEFAEARDMEFPVCDIYLNYPIDIKAFDFSKIEKKQDIFTEKVKDIIRDKEFSFLGYEFLTYQSGEKQIRVRVSLYCISDNENATLSVMLPVSTCNPTILWERAFAGKLEVESRGFAEYLDSKYNIKVLDEPKIIIFSSGEIDESKRIEVFLVEEDKDNNFDISKLANTDISKSDDMQIYESENVKIEIPNNFEVCYTDRLKSLIQTLSV